MYPLVDSHVHLHEYGGDWAGYCGGRYLMLAVSDDVGSSLKTIELGKKCELLVPAVGVHPWNADKVSVNQALRAIEALVTEHNVPFLGEVGLDRVFHPETIEVQMVMFEGFLRIASEHGLGLSVHAAGAWREVLDLLKKHRVTAAVFHWYTGPLELISEIVGEGYFIGINPALLVQKKHEAVLERSPIEHVLTESDGPYSYRGLVLGPELIESLIRRISEVKSMEMVEVSEQIVRNFRRLLSLVAR